MGSLSGGWRALLGFCTTARPPQSLWYVDTAKNTRTKTVELFFYGSVQQKVSVVWGFLKVNLIWWRGWRGGTSGAWRQEWESTSNLTISSQWSLSAASTFWRCSVLLWGSCFQAFFIFVVFGTWSCFVFIKNERKRLLILYKLSALRMTSVSFQEQRSVFWWVSKLVALASISCCFHYCFFFFWTISKFIIHFYVCNVEDTRSNDMTQAIWADYYKKYLFWIKEKHWRKISFWKSLLNQWHLHELYLLLLHFI